MSNELHSFGNQSNACRGKVRYPSKRVAAGRIRVMKQRQSPGAHRLQEYRCRECKHWHVGNSRRIA